MGESWDREAAIDMYENWDKKEEKEKKRRDIDKKYRLTGRDMYSVQIKKDRQKRRRRERERDQNMVLNLLRYQHRDK